MNRVLIITGGTGGHIFPALAVGECLRNMNVKMFYLVRKNKKDIDLIKKYNFDYRTIPASGFFGKNIYAMFLFMINVLLSMLIVPILILKIKPSAIIASGGFVCFVPLIWTLILQRKFFLLEQNAIPGRLTKYFSRWAKEIYLGLPLLKPISGRTLYTGNPLRLQISNIAKESSNNILVLGGSQGAKFLNLVAIELAAQLPDLNFVIQTGIHNYEYMKKLVKSKNCELIDFTLSPETLYNKAKLVITRAGAMVLSEILLFGIPSIIIPFPFATDNHQAANAQFLAQNNAAIILDQGRQHGLSNDFILKIKEIIQSLINDNEKLTKMSNNAKKLAKTDSAKIIAERITQCLEK